MVNLVAEFTNFLGLHKALTKWVGFTEHAKPEEIKSRLNYPNLAGGMDSAVSFNWPGWTS